MKTILKFFAIVLFIITVQNCSDDQEDVKSEKVSFTFNLSEIGKSNGRILSGSLPEGAALMISIETMNGVSIYKMKKIDILFMGSSYVTEPVELPSRDYKITDFLIVKGSKVLFAVPKTPSALSAAVAHPLPYKFRVDKDKVTTVDMQVIDVTSRSPEELGYASFGITVVNVLRLSVFITEDQKVKLTNAKGYLLSGKDTVSRFTLGAKVNLVSFTGDASKTYRLAIIKNGYESYVKDFVYQDLIKELGGKPLKIYLKAAFTIWSNRDGTPQTFNLKYSGGTLKVNWGDGTIEPLPSNSWPSHTYPSGPSYPISITGDIDKITYFYSFYGDGEMEAINLKGLTGLTEIRIGLMMGPKVIDLSNSKLVNFMMLSGIGRLEDLIIPKENKISYADISGPSQLTTSDIDQFVNNVYHSAVKDKRLKGQLYMTNDWSVTTDEWVANPSPGSIEKLRHLRDQYQWKITPNP